MGGTRLLGRRRRKRSWGRGSLGFFRSAVILLLVGVLLCSV